MRYTALKESDGTVLSAAKIHLSGRKSPLSFCGRVSVGDIGIIGSYNGTWRRVNRPANQSLLCSTCVELGLGVTEVEEAIKLKYDAFLDAWFSVISLLVDGSDEQISRARANANNLYIEFQELGGTPAGKDRVDE